MSRSSDRARIFRQLRDVGSFGNRITTLEQSGVGGGGEHIASAPPTGDATIVNAYYDPGQGKIIIEYDTDADPTGTLQSTPPQGSFEITNMYMSGGSLVLQYDDAP